MNHGDVWWADLPEAGRRPACVLTRDAGIPFLRSVVVALATRTVRGVPSEVALDEDDGMPSLCVLSFDNLTTIPKALLTERITSLSAGKRQLACEALAFATGCP